MARTAALVAAIVGSAMGFIDGSAVNVALPVMQRDFNAAASQLQWIIEGYALFLSSLILTGGALGDRYGHRRTFVVGISIFAVASAICAAAPSIEIAIAARCLQGIGAALFVPESLALISENYSGASRGKAIGLWSASSAITAALGPVLGGWLAGSYSWRYVFVINLPLAVFVIAICLLRVDATHGASKRAIDVTGSILATLGLGALTYALIDLQGQAMKPSDAMIGIAGIILLAAFAAFEHRARTPMFDHRLFAAPSFVGANCYTLLLYAALGGSLYFVPFDLINVQHYTPFEAGLSLLPFIAIVSAASSYSGMLAARVGAKIPLTIGAFVATAAFLGFARIGIGGSYWTTVFPAAVLLGCAGALFVAPLTTVVMSSVDSSDAGIASAVNNAAARVAGLLAVAVLGYVLALVFDASLSHSGTALTASQHASVLSGHVDTAGMTPAQRSRAIAAVASAYSRGFAAAMLASAGLCAVAALLALFWNWRDVSVGQTAVRAA